MPGRYMMRLPGSLVKVVDEELDEELDASDRQCRADLPRHGVGDRGCGCRDYQTE